MHNNLDPLGLFCMYVLIMICQSGHLFQICCCTQPHYVPLSPLIFDPLFSQVGVVSLILVDMCYAIISFRECSSSLRSLLHLGLSSRERANFYAVYLYHPIGSGCDILQSRRPLIMSSPIHNRKLPSCSFMEQYKNRMRHRAT